MRIVNLTTFLSLKDGTVFSKYEPYSFEDPMVKVESLKGVPDFLYDELTEAVDCTGSDDFVDILSHAQASGCSFNSDFEQTGRDGCFEENQLFVIYEQEDVEKLIARLQRALKEGY